MDSFTRYNFIYAVHGITVHAVHRLYLLTWSFDITLLPSCFLDRGWLSGWVPDSCLKGHGFDSPQKRWEHFLLHGQLSVLTLISELVITPYTDSVKHSRIPQAFSLTIKRSTDSSQLKWPTQALHTVLVNMLDPIQKRFGYGQHAARIGPVRICQIWLPTSDSVPFFQRRPGSDLDGLVRFWPTASGPDANQCASTIQPGSDRTQPARYQFPTFRLRCILPQTALIILCKTAPSDLVMADCQVWVKRVWSRSKSVCKNLWVRF